MFERNTQKNRNSRAANSYIHKMKFGKSNTRCKKNYEKKIRDMFCILIQL